MRQLRPPANQLPSTPGARAEQHVANQLKKEGFSIVARNFKVRGGEIDIIADNGDILALVEVKFRSNMVEHSSDFFTQQKIRGMYTAGKSFLQKHPTYLQTRTIRIDLAIVQEHEGSLVTQYIPAALSWETYYE